MSGSFVDEVKDILTEYGISIDNGLLKADNDMGIDNLAVLTRPVNAHQHCRVLHYGKIFYISVKGYAGFFVEKLSIPLGE